MSASMSAMRPLYLTAFFLVSIMTVGHYDTAKAQEISDAHLTSARKAIEATRATESYDPILFDAATRTKNEFISANPDLADAISTIVDEEALKLASRRAALETEAARLFANSFSVSELDEIAAFFSSPAGSKYNESTPILARELSRAARVWASGINRDLSNAVQTRILKVAPDTAAPKPAADAETPAETSGN